LRETPDSKALDGSEAANHIRRYRQAAVTSVLGQGRTNRAIADANMTGEAVGEYLQALVQNVSTQLGLTHCRKTTCGHMRYMMAT
jgi:hypothetical protein